LRLETFAPALDYPEPPPPLRRGHLPGQSVAWRAGRPASRHGQNYHQWLSAQFGLKKLVEHIWMLIGVARTCETMTELRDRMAQLNGKHPVQLRMYLPAPGKSDIRTRYDDPGYREQRDAEIRRRASRENGEAAN
jgi:hypothetical protein